MPEPQSRTPEAIAARWDRLAEIEFKSIRDYARLGEQAFMDVRALLDCLAAARAGIATEVPVVAAVEYGCRSHLGDEWGCDDRADAESVARGRGGVVIERVVGPGMPHPPADGFCGAEFIDESGETVRCQRGTHYGSRRDPEHMLMGFPVGAAS
jgi:hypothetical protein